MRLPCSEVKLTIAGKQFDRMNQWSGSSEVRRLEERVRELERLLGRKTMEVEILKEALAKAESKKPSLRLLSQPKDASR